jgi:hypothetical protein
VVESGQGLDEKITPFVRKLVSPCRKHIQGLVKVEVIVTENKWRNLY